MWKRFGLIKNRPSPMRAFFLFFSKFSQPILSNVYSSTLLGTALAGAALLFDSAAPAVLLWLSKARSRCLLMRHCSEMTSRCRLLKFPPSLSSSLGNATASSHVKIWLPWAMGFFVEMTIRSLPPKLQAVLRPQVEPTWLKLLCRHLSSSGGS